MAQLMKENKEKQIHVLEFSLKQSQNKRDIKLHTQSLNVLKEGLRALKEVEKDLRQPEEKNG